MEGNTLNLDAAMELARSGKDAWNEWAADHVGWSIDFQGADLRDGSNRISFKGFVFPGDITFKRVYLCESNSFAEAEFLGRVNFTQVRFEGDADFKNAKFHKFVNFSSGHFSKSICMNKASFFHQAKFDFVHIGEFADFEEAYFERHVWAHKVNFGSGACFRVVRFCQQAVISECEFHDNANFEEVQFEDRALLDSNQFLQGASFDSARFSDEADFQNTSFEKEARFPACTFEGKADFSHSVFLCDASFEESVFKGIAAFEHIRFESDFDIRDVVFEQQASFRASRLAAALRLDNAKFGSVPDFQSTRMDHHVSMASAQVPFDGSTFWKYWQTSLSKEDAAKYRRLKEMANTAQDHYLEQEFFAFEQMSMRGREYKRLAVVPSLAYESFSDFGRSLHRPMIGLLLVWIAFAIINLVAATVRAEVTFLSIESLVAAIVVSAPQIFPFVAGSSAARTWATDKLFFDVAPGWIHILNLFEGLLGFMFLFLVGLAIRNRFKL